MWAVWLVGLALLFVFSGVSLLLVGVIVVIAVFWLAKPIQSRVFVDEPSGERDSSVFQTAIGRGSERDRAVRELLYGEEPVLAALEQAGMSRLWIWLRRAIVAATVVAFLFILFPLA